MDDEDFFSDDDFADIPDNALQALEQNAIISTQRPRVPNATQTGQNGTQAPRKQPHNETSLNRPGTRTGGGNLPWRPPQPRPGPHNPSQPLRVSADGPLPGAPALLSSDYGMDEETVIDLDGPAGPGLPAIAASGKQWLKPPMDAETEAAFATADAELDLQLSRPQPSSVHIQAQSMDVSALQARVAALEAEQMRLRQSEQEARALAQSKQGEIQIVRAKLENSTKGYENRLAAMQKQHVDEISKQKAELEAGRKEREQMETDNRFLHHDLAQEAERARRSTALGRVRALAGSRAETPRKSKRQATGMGDGFDDLEVQTVSPSKSKDRSREQTPKAGMKRKRMAQDSPIPLALTQPPLSFKKEDSLQTNTSAELVLGNGVAAVCRDGRFEYYRTLMNHRPHDGHERSFEAFARYTFPSRPDKSLASLFADKIARCETLDTDEFAHAVATALLDFWSQCLREKFFTPFYLILSMLRFVLREQLSSLACLVMEQALPLCIRSIDLIAVDTVKAAMWGPAYAASVDWTSHANLAEQIDVDEVMEFLLELCQAAALAPDRLTRFWKTMELTFILQMLHRAQSISLITSTLKILGLSSLEGSFGVITDDAAKQNKQENDIIDRLTNLLFEVPVAPGNEPDYTTEELAALRIAVLNVFQAMCRTNHGGMLLAQHRSTIGRLVRFLDGQMSRLYTEHPSWPSVHDRLEDSAHDLISQSVNLTTRLLYHLLRTYDDAIDIVQKLRAVLGGYHKFLVSLSRVAFGEQLVFESGLDDAAAEAAHAILDRILGPDDGEAVMKAIETPRSGGGSITRSGREPSVIDVG